MPSAALVPFRWPGSWNDPALLGLLKGGPINCLLMGPDSAAAAGAARQAGLTVLDPASLAGTPVTETRRDQSDSPVVITDRVWPRLKIARRGETDSAEAGPTGAPWIDSNSWAARLAAVRTPGKPIWLSFAPDPQAPPPDEAAYLAAIADSAASGARWMITLDDSLAQRIRTGQADAVKTWRAILSALSFFETRRAWAAWEPWGPVGILSTFTGDVEFMGQEALNLAARRNLLHRVLDRASPSPPVLQGLRAVLYVDSQAPAAPLHRHLTAFANQGGLLIVPSALAPRFPAGRTLPCPVAGYRLQSLGRGAVAAALREWDDPYFLVSDVHSLVSRRHDPVQMFNGGSLWMHYALAPQGGAALLQFVGFSGRSNQSVSLVSARKWRSVLMHTLSLQEPAVLPAIEVDNRTEFHLPAFSTYAALEFRP